MRSASNNQILNLVIRFGGSFRNIIVEHVERVSSVYVLPAPIAEHCGLQGPECYAITVNSCESGIHLRKWNLNKK